MAQMQSSSSDASPEKDPTGESHLDLNHHLLGLYAYHLPAAKKTWPGTVIRAWDFISRTQSIKKMKKNQVLAHFGNFDKHELRELEFAFRKYTGQTLSGVIQLGQTEAAKLSRPGEELLVRQIAAGVSPIVCKDGDDEDEEETQFDIWLN